MNAGWRENRIRAAQCRAPASILVIQSSRSTRRSASCLANVRSTFAIASSAGLIARRYLISLGSPTITRLSLPPRAAASIWRGAWGHGATRDRRSRWLACRFFPVFFTQTDAAHSDRRSSIFRIQRNARIGSTPGNGCNVSPNTGRVLLSSSTVTHRPSPAHPDAGRASRHLETGA